MRTRAARAILISIVDVDKLNLIAFTIIEALRPREALSGSACHFGIAMLLRRLELLLSLYGMRQEGGAQFQGCTWVHLSTDAPAEQATSFA